MKSLSIMLRAFGEWLNRRKPIGTSGETITVAEAERLDRLRNPEKYRGKD